MGPWFSTGPTVAAGEKHWNSLKPASPCRSGGLARSELRDGSKGARRLAVMGKDMTMFCRGVQIVPTNAHARAEVH
jgi:hypothetical protein